MSTPVLVLLHYQNDVLHEAGRIRVGLGEGDLRRYCLIDAASALLQGARNQGWSIVHVRIAFRADYADLSLNMPILRSVAELGAVRDGMWGAEYFDALAPVKESPKEFSITHTRISAFYGTQLDALLRMLSSNRLVVAGVATHSVVESTVRDAADRGFQVFVAADACIAADAQAHEASLLSMRLIAEVSDAKSLLSRLGNGDVDD